MRRSRPWPTGDPLGNVRVQASRSTAVQVETLNNGVLIGARRNLPDGGEYWRTNLFMMPFYTQSPQDYDHFNAWVPMDDEHTPAGL